MKRFSIILVITMSVIFATMPSCSKDDNPCDGVTCQNSGSCNEGKCQCPSFVTGENCDKQTRTKFYGTYSGSLYDLSSLDSTTIVLSEYPGDYSKVLWDGDKYFVITPTTQVNIPKQSVGPGETISGFGAYYNGTLTLQWTHETPTGENFWTFTGMKI